MSAAGKQLHVSSCMSACQQLHVRHVSSGMSAAGKQLLANMEQVKGEGRPRRCLAY